MYKFVYLAIFGAIGTSMFNHSFPDMGLRSVGDQFIKPVSAQVSRVSADANKTIDSLQGVVTAVSDGDTLTINTEYGNSIIRLFAIDAPEATCHGFSDKVCSEAGQPDATASKLYLRALTLNKTAVVKLGQGISGKRLVGTVLVDGKDINLEMVKAGHAWHYKYFSKNQTPDDKKAYSDAELNAKWLHSGLWADSNPIEPWVYRKQHKSF